MARVVGIGGVYFKSRDPFALRAWYQRHLGFPAGDADHPSVSFPLTRGSDDSSGFALWAPFWTETKYFSPSDRDFMINLRVDDLESLITRLEAAGIPLIGDPIDDEYGRFAWIVDPEGTKIELWEPTPDRQEN